DTLDYSGAGLNEGSKVVIAAAGPPCRKLLQQPSEPVRLPEGFALPRAALPGVLVIQAPAWTAPTLPDEGEPSAQRFCALVRPDDPLNEFPLLVLADDSEFTAASLANFLWVTFTRSNPAADIYGTDSFMSQKHWGCRGALVIDARIKPHHAPALEEDPEV